MHRCLLAAAVAAFLVGCGKDKPTEPKNPNPNATHHTIVVTSTFTPDTQNAIIGDTIIWQVSASETGRHQISFTDLPEGVTHDPTGVLVAGDTASAIFIQSGVYKYTDDTTHAQGVLMVNPLP
jgi:plastocyanin